MSNNTPPPMVGSEGTGSLKPPGMQPDAEPGGTAVRLWTARDVGVVSFLLGFPAGFALTAVNWHHLGSRNRAYGLLVAGAILFLALAVPSHLPTAIALGLNVGMTVMLSMLVKRQWAAADEAGRPAEPGGALRGLLVSAGGWFATLLPTVLLFFVLAFLGAQVSAILKSTVEFGTGGGDQCAVTGAATTFSTNQAIHLAAHLNREVVSGETVRLSLSDPTGKVLDAADRPVTATADCFAGAFEAGTFEPGSYSLDYRVGPELLAHGQFIVLSPGRSP